MSVELCYAELDRNDSGFEVGCIMGIHITNMLHRCQETLKDPALVKAAMENVYAALERLAPQRMQIALYFKNRKAAKELEEGFEEKENNSKPNPNRCPTQ